jgi:hypothetical protein
MIPPAALRPARGLKVLELCSTIAGRPARGCSPISVPTS